MKPILVFIEEKHGNINITKEELERLLNEVYMRGREDATSYIRTTPTSPLWEHNKPTCEV